MPRTSPPSAPSCSTPVQRRHAVNVRPRLLPVPGRRQVGVVHRHHVHPRAVAHPEGAPCAATTGSCLEERQLQTFRAPGASQLDALTRGGRPALSAPRRSASSCARTRASAVSSSQGRRVCSRTALVAAAAGKARVSTLTAPPAPPRCRCRACAGQHGDRRPRLLVLVSSTGGPPFSWKLAYIWLGASSAGNRRVGRVLDFRTCLLCFWQAVKHHARAGPGDGHEQRLRCGELRSVGGSHQLGLSRQGALQGWLTAVDAWAGRPLQTTIDANWRNFDFFTTTWCSVSGATCPSGSGLILGLSLARRLPCRSSVPLPSDCTLLPADLPSLSGRAAPAGHHGLLHGLCEHMWAPAGHCLFNRHGCLAACLPGVHPSPPRIDRAPRLKTKPAAWGPPACAGRLTLPPARAPLPNAAQTATTQTSCRSGMSSSTSRPPSARPATARTGESIAGLVVERLSRVRAKGGGLLGRLAWRRRRKAAHIT